MPKTAIRREDMSPDGCLSVTLADDGDVHVTATDGEGNSVSVGFCSIGSAGGCSPPHEQSSSKSV